MAEPLHAVTVASMAGMGINGDGGAGRGGQSQAGDVTVSEGRKTNSAGMAMTRSGIW